MRRFYSDVTICPEQNHFTIRLDGKPVKTPARTTLAVRTKALADAIADEWLAQELFIVPATMPLTQLASTALDRVSPNIEATIDAIVEYAKTDLVCYRADAPDELVATQSALLDPLLEWFEERTGHDLIVARGLMPITQPPEPIAAVREILAQKLPEVLTAIQVGAALASSLVIPLALCEGEISARQAYESANSEEIYQLEKWGDDDEARGRLELHRQEFIALERFVGLLAN